MRVLLTRPREDSEQLALLLCARGHEAVISPVLEIRFFGGPEISLNGVQAILATSANGVRALARRTARRDILLFAVGPQTAAAAESAGFSNVRNAKGNAASLAQVVRDSASPGGGALLCASGQERRSDLERCLQHDGFTVRLAVLYEALEQPALNPDAVAALEAGKLDAVMLFSPRSAAIFARQLQAAALEHVCAKMMALCISEAVASALQPLKFAELRIAARPDQEGMLARLG